jgi:hypothetical protein
MRKMALLAAVVCLISCYGMNAFAQTAPHFIGSSAASVKGAHFGQAGMNQACINTFGGTAGTIANTHMCSTDEFFNTAGLGGNGVLLWIQPALHNCVSDGLQVTCQEAGAPAVVPESNVFLTCGQWTQSTGLTGTAAIFGTNTGWTLVTGADCSQSHRVACCQ